jgi:membrane protein YqaA with SNARE-associated domain
METKTQQVTWWHLHRRLYDWVIHFAHTPHGERALFLLSFAESSCFPVPPDVLLAPLALGVPKKWFRFATICSIASVLGGILGYGIGIFLWFLVGNFFHNYVPGFSWDKVILNDGTEVKCVIAAESVDTEGFLMNVKTKLNYPLRVICDTKEEKTFNQQDVKDVQVKTFSIVGDQYREYGWQIVAFAGFTPFPYKVITITSGIFQVNFLVFVIASVLSRSARFYMVAGLFGWKGEAMRPFIEKYFNWLSLLFFVLLIGGFMAIKLIK